MGAHYVPGSILGDRGEKRTERSPLQFWGELGEQMHHRMWGRVGLGREIRDPEEACVLSARETRKGNAGRDPQDGK